MSKSKYDSFSREQLIDKIQKLEKERYGLVWEDKEEDVAKRCEADYHYWKKTAHGKLYATQLCLTILLLKEITIILCTH